MAVFGNKLTCCFYYKLGSGPQTHEDSLSMILRELRTPCSPAIRRYGSLPNFERKPIEAVFHFL